ncbi:unnamed protein product [Arctia plantaginis]|uniref:L-dopachrome isomerase n=1 Tax=Arctia plantaginis TaxID=874455 RepID=A0A8S0Z2C6_ARCPL|nr:unnamed protein product [Arctia plantaginis]
MPCLKIFTNLPKDKIPEDFTSKMIPVLSRTVRKPENEFVVAISTDCTVAYGGQPKGRPGAVATLESISHLGLEENKIIAKEISELIHKELDIAPDQLMITFYDIKGLNVAKFGVIVCNINKINGACKFFPRLSIFTNLAKDKIPENFISKILPVLSRTLRKEEERFVVVVTTDCTVAFGHQGTGNASAVASLESIGNLGAEENKIITKEVTEFFRKELGVAPENCLITYYDLKSQNVAKNGLTFAEMLAKK